MSEEIKKFVGPIKEAVQGYVQRSLASFVERLSGVEKRLEFIPEGATWEGLKGKDGATGRDGADGQAGVHGADGGKGEKGDKGDTGEKGEQGMRGIPGDAGAAGHDGKDGMAGEKGADGAQGLSGKDGRDGIDGKDGAQGVSTKGVDGAPGIDGRDGRDGKDGSPGRDALQIDILPSLDETRSYARGTFASFRGGVVRAFRATDPIGENLETCGWAVILRGIDSELGEFADDGRTEKRITRYTDGTTLERTVTRPNQIYRGIWKEGDYAKGDTVTRDGCLWHANKSTNAVPGSSEDWQLSVKKGRDGRDGLRGEKGLPGLNGKDGAFVRA